MNPSSLLKKLFPFLDWFPLTKRAVRDDFIAGITVALVLVPQSMAYAQLGGMPAHYGLYASLIPVVVAALWGSSPHASSGPVAITSLLAAVTLIPYAQPETPEFIELAILLAFMVGVIRLVVGAFKITFFMNLISLPVLKGFTNAAGVIIVISQLDKLFGFSVESGDFLLADLVLIARRAGELNWAALAMGIGTLGLLFFLRRFARRFPSAMAAVAITGLIAYLFRDGGGEAMRNLPLVGFIPKGLPSFSVPEVDIGMMIDLLPGAVVVSLIGFLEVGAITKSISMKSKRPVDLDQELVGQGLSCLAGSFFQSFPTSVSFSRSALSYSAGTKTGLSSVVTGIFVLITVVFFSSLLSYIPRAVLGAIIIFAITGILDFRSLVGVWRISAFDGAAAAVTFVASLAFAPNMIYGILVGAGLSIILHLYRTMKPGISVLGRGDVGDVGDADLHVRFDGRIYFGSARYFEKGMEELVRRFSQTKRLIIHGEGIHHIDSTGIQAVSDLVERLNRRGITLCFAGLRNHSYRIFERSGLTGMIGEDNFLKSFP